MLTGFPSIAKNDFHTERANDLRRMAEILIKYNIIRDGGPLLSAATKCQQVADEAYYEYEIPHLLFHDLPEGVMHHARPQDVKATDFHIDLKVDLCGVVTDDETIEDPFTYLVIDLFIGGEMLTEDCSIRQLKCAWHFDRHEEGGNVNSTKKNVPKKGRSHAVHPIYHFQHGGQRVWDLSDYGEQLLLEPPRIAHPPLDGILAIDFVLSNYLGDSWKMLRDQEHRYDEIVKEAQRRCWRAYALTSASLWQNQVYDGWQADAIWPQLAASFYPSKSSSH